MKILINIKEIKVREINKHNNIIYLKIIAMI